MCVFVTSLPLSDLLVKRQYGMIAQSEKTPAKRKRKHNPMVYRTNEIAQTCNVTVNTVRNWCKEFGAYLSPGATVTSGHRRFTERDRNVLLYVAQLRNENMTQNAILQRLSETTFPEIAGPEEESAIEVPTDAPDAPRSDLAPIVALDDLQTRVALLERSVQAHRPNWWLFVAGIVVGLGFAAIAELFALVARR